MAALSPLLPGQRAEIVSLIPAVSGGVHDYAQVLGRHIPSRILAATPETALSDYGNGQIVLHFSGYGFHPRGIPMWLVQRVRQLRRQGARVGIYFHELFASSMQPWRSAFWLSPMQRHIARELGGQADYWLTSHEDGASWLRRHCPAVPHRVQPVYSNVGEPDTMPRGRTDRIVVFGTPLIRARTYALLDDAFWHWTQVQGLQVHDIGPSIDSDAFRQLVETGRVQAHGKLEAADVSLHLAQARFGLLSYPQRVIAKSGIFAAYCSHGLCPVLLSDRYHDHEHLHAGRHYIPGLTALMRQECDPAAVGKAAYSWYQPHRSQAHAAAVLELIGTTHEHRARP